MYLYIYIANINMEYIMNVGNDVRRCFIKIMLSCQYSLSITNMHFVL